MTTPTRYEEEAQRIVDDFYVDNNEVRASARSRRKLVETIAAALQAVAETRDKDWLHGAQDEGLEESVRRIVTTLRPGSTEDDPNNEFVRVILKRIVRAVAEGQRERDAAIVLDPQRWNTGDDAYGYYAIAEHVAAAIRQAREGG